MTTTTTTTGATTMTTTTATKTFYPGLGRKAGPCPPSKSLSPYLIL
jgi:hypothetical protein